MKRFLALVLIALASLSSFAQSGKPVISISTIPELLSRSPVPGETALVDGYDVIGDWGAPRVFTAVDNYVGATNSGHVFRSNNKTNFTYVSRDANAIAQDIRWFRADQTGVRDSAFAIRDATRYVGSAFGVNRSGHVAIPVGEFTLFATNFVVNQRIAVRGVHNDLGPGDAAATNGLKGSVLRFTFTNNLDGISLRSDGSSTAFGGFEISDLTLIGNPLMRDCIHLHGADGGITSSYNGLIKNLYITSAGRHGLAIGEDTLDNNPQCSGLVIERVTVGTSRKDNFMLGNGTQNGTGNSLTLLTSINAGRNGLAIHGWGNESIIQFVESNSSLLEVGAGAYFHNNRQLIVNGVVEASGRDASAGGGGIPINRSYGVLIEGATDCVFTGLNITTIAGDKDYLNNGSVTNIGLLTMRSSTPIGNYGALSCENNRFLSVRAFVYSYSPPPPSFFAIGAGAMPPGTYRFRMTATYRSFPAFDWSTPVAGGNIYTADIPWGGVTMHVDPPPVLAAATAIGQTMWWTRANETNNWLVAATIPHALATNILINTDNSLQTNFAALTPTFYFDDQTKNNIFETLSVGNTPSFRDLGHNNYTDQVNIISEAARDRPETSTGANDTWFKYIKSIRLNDLITTQSTSNTPPTLYLGTNQPMATLDFQQPVLNFGADKNPYPYKRTTGTDQRAALVMNLPYFDAIYPFSMIVGDATTALTFVGIGGGSSAYRAANTINFYASPQIAGNSKSNLMSGLAVAAITDKGMLIAPGSAFNGPTGAGVTFDNSGHQITRGDLTVGNLPRIAQIDLQRNIIGIGADNATATNRVDGVAKRAAIVMPPATAGARQVAMIIGDNSTGGQSLSIGGGSSSYDGMGAIFFATTPFLANNITTNRVTINHLGMRIDPLGANAGPTAGTSLLVTNGITSLNRVDMLATTNSFLYVAGFNTDPTTGQPKTLLSSTLQNFANQITPLISVGSLPTGDGVTNVAGRYYGNYRPGSGVAFVTNAFGAVTVSSTVGGGIPDATADSKYYSRFNNTWVDGATVFQGLDTDLTQIANITGAAGDILYHTGATWAKRSIGADGLALVASGGVPVWASIGSGGIPDAPNTGINYGRKNLNWNNLDAIYQPLDTDLTQLASIVGAQGDVIYHDGTSWQRRPRGTDGQVLTQSGNIPIWATVPSVGPFQPLDADLTDLGNIAGNTGDLIVHQSGHWTRFAPGGNGSYLQITGGFPTWGSIGSFQPLDTDLTQIAALVAAGGDIIYHNGTTWAKLPKGTAGQVLTMDGTGTLPTWAAPTGGGTGPTFNKMMQVVGWGEFQFTIVGGPSSALVNVTYGGVVDNVYELNSPSAGGITEPLRVQVHFNSNIGTNYQALVTLDNTSTSDFNVVCEGNPTAGTAAKEHIGTETKITISKIGGTGTGGGVYARVWIVKYVDVPTLLSGTSTLSFTNVVAKAGIQAAVTNETLTIEGKALFAKSGAAINVGPSSAAELTVFDFSIPANALSEDGDVLTARSFGNILASGGGPAKTFALRTYLDGVAVMDDTSSTIANGANRKTVDVVLTLRRTSATTAECMIELIMHTASLPGPTTGIGSLSTASVSRSMASDTLTTDFANPTQLKMTAQLSVSSPTFSMTFKGYHANILH